MAYGTPVEPVPFGAAFEREDDAANLSRAAALLLLRNQLKGDDVAFRARAMEFHRAAEPIPPEDLSRLAVPRLSGKGLRVPEQPLRDRLVRRYGEQLRKGPGATGTAADIARRLEKEPTLEVAAELAEASMTHSDELTRVAAAAARLETVANPEPSLAVLRHGLQSEDELVREVAATVLARVDPADPLLARLTRKPRSTRGGSATRTALLVHGTWARQSTWWQPGGDFHAYVSGFRPDLYGASDRFEWTGGYTPVARARAAVQLTDWLSRHDLERPDLMTHSHGGSVAMLATQHGLSVRDLVLLSCPVHPHEYWPAFDRIARVVSVRVKLDLVILADGGGQLFDDPKITENVLPVWFNHSATHFPAVWNLYEVRSKISW